MKAYALLLASFVTLGTATASAGCARTLAPNQVETLGTRAYPSRTRADLVRASDVALRTMGYEVVVSDAKAGVVKTAPKAVMVHAAGGGGRAVAVSNDMAWSLEITPSADGVVVHARPRARSAGQSYDGPWNADYVEKAIADLYAEIDENLGAPAERAAAKTKR